MWTAADERISECSIDNHAQCCGLKGFLRVLYVVQFDDQGIVNSDSRTIAVPHDYANYIPTDIRGLTFARTPAQVQLCNRIITPGPG